MIESSSARREAAWLRLRTSGTAPTGTVQGTTLKADASTLESGDQRPEYAMDINNLDAVEAFVTKDGSEIRELLAHRNSVIRHQSLAEARVEPGARTTAHYHPRTEEIYYILSGRARITIDGCQKEVGPGDAIAIPPGAIHQIENTGTETLKFLCCCAPGYEDEDTVMV